MNEDESGKIDKRRDAPLLARVSEGQILDEELFRMAAFRIRETAKRIATLANSAGDETLRAQLMAVCDRLLEQERQLLELTRRSES